MPPIDRSVELGSFIIHKRSIDRSVESVESLAGESAAGKVLHAVLLRTPRTSQLKATAMTQRHAT